MNNGKEMSFLEHLEELRWHLLRSVIAILIFMVIALFSTKFVFHYLILGPSRPDFWTFRVLCQLSEAMGSPALCVKKLNFTLQSRQLSGQFMMHLSSSMVFGLICAFPYVFWEIWRFVKDGLYENEAKSARGATVWVSLLFMLGILFGYYVLSPISINFLASYQIDPSIVNEIDITSYVSTLITFVVGCGFLFQLPIVIYFLTAAGLLTANFLIQYRRYSIVIILIISAIITPPDVFSQILVAIPLQVLYEVSIIIARRVEKRKLRDEMVS